MRMELSYFLGQLFGLSLAMVAVAGLIRPQLIDGVIKDVKQHPALSLLFGFTGVVMGLAIVLSHNLWVTDWRVFITIVGWGALLKGAMYLAAPQGLFSLATAVYGTPQRTKLILVLAGVVGLYVATKAFGY